MVRMTLKPPTKSFPKLAWSFASVGPMIGGTIYAYNHKTGKVYTDKPLSSFTRVGDVQKENSTHKGRSMMNDDSGTELTATTGIMESYIEQAIQSRARWIEGSLRTLVLDGVELSRISIEDHPNARTVINVDSIPRGEWQINWQEEHSVPSPS